MFYDIFIRECSKIKKYPNTVAKEIGISSGTITQWKSGRTPRDSTVLKLAEYFGVTPEYMMHGSAGRRATPHGNELNTIVPVYGTVPAGIPLEAIEDIIDYEEITPEMAAKGKYISLKIKGDSMQPKIIDGDVVIVRLQDDADTGDTVIVMINGGDATCKKIKKTPEGVWLIPNNPAYEAMFYSNQQVIDLPLNILGKVVELRRTF